MAVGWLFFSRRYRCHWQHRCFLFSSLAILRSSSRTFLSLFLSTGLPVFLSLCVFFSLVSFSIFLFILFRRWYFFAAAIAADAAALFYIRMRFLCFCSYLLCVGHFSVFRWIVNCYCIWELRKCAFMLNESTHKHIHTRIYSHSLDKQPPILHTLYSRYNK